MLKTKYGYFYFIIGLILSTMIMFDAFSQKKTELIRKLKFANSWYEGDCKLLNKQLDNYLNNLTPSAKHIFAIITPHAGYLYSGAIAGNAYATIAKLKPKRIFLLGPSHYVGFEGVMLPQYNSFATPCGHMEIDQNVIKELKKNKLFQISNEIHANEHSLEIQLPFIYKLFPDAKLIPLIVGTIPNEDILSQISLILKKNINESDLIIISSDFTHYGPRYDYIPFTENINTNLQKLDMKAYDSISKIDAHQFLNFQTTTKDTICGMYPIAILLKLLPKDAQAHLIKYTTSNEVIHEESHNCVSYMAINFTVPDKVNSNSDIFMQKNYLLNLAKETLTDFVTKNSIKKIDAQKLPIDLKDDKGVFVTLYKIDDNGEKNLRGCIGNIFPVKPLYQAIIDNTILAASRDNRFLPVTANELAKIKIEINILTKPKPVNSFNDIKLGVDGIILNKDDATAVFLPEVATEYNWTLSQTLTQLSIKAGLDASAWQKNCKFSVFQSVVLK